VRSALIKLGTTGRFEVAKQETVVVDGRHIAFSSDQGGQMNIWRISAD
jgi:Tol biopolymer transport system component